MALSQISYTYAGQSSFDIPFALGILSREYVTVRINDETDGNGDPLYYEDYGWINDSEITVSNLTVGDVVTVSRTVPKTELTVDFEAGANITSRNLNGIAKQCLMIYHELLDGRIDGLDDLASLAQQAADSAAEAAAIAGDMDDLRSLLMNPSQVVGANVALYAAGSYWAHPDGGVAPSVLNEANLLGAGFFNVSSADNVQLIHTNTTLAVPAAHATIRDALDFLSRKVVQPKVLVRIEVSGNYDTTNEELYGLSENIIIEAATIPSPLTEAEVNLTPMTGVAATDATNKAADKTRIKALIETRYAVKLRYTQGDALILKNRSIGSIDGIAFIGEDGNTATAIICGDRNGYSGTGASLGMDTCAWFGFQTGIGTTYGGCIKCTDNTMFIGFMDGTNIQIQYRGMFFAKGAIVVYSGLYNIFCKRGGLTYLSGQAGDYTSLVSHAAFNNIVCGGAGVCHVVETTIGPCGGLSVYASKGGFIAISDSTLDGQNACTELVRNEGGQVILESSILKNVIGFALRNISGTTYVGDAEFQDATASAIYMVGGQVVLGAIAIGATVIRSDSGGLSLQGGTVTGSLELRQSNTPSGTIASWLRLERGFCDLDSVVIVNPTTITTRDIYVLRYSAVTIRIDVATVAGAAITDANILIRNRDNFSAPATNSNGVLEYNTNPGVDAVIAY